MAWATIRVFGCRIMKQGEYKLRPQCRHTVGGERPAKSQAHVQNGLTWRYGYKPGDVTSSGTAGGIRWPTKKNATGQAVAVGIGPQPVTAV